MSPVRHHTIQQRMIETIDRQLASGSRLPWVLEMGPKKLRMVRSFVLSFTVEPSDRVIPYMSFLEPEGVEPVALGKPSDIEVIAERLAKVEDRQAALDAMFTEGPNRLNRRQERLDDRIDTSERQTREAFAMVNDRIDKVAEIIGERVSGLADQLEALARKAGSVEAEHSDKLDQHSRDIGRLLHLIFDEKPAPAFPTGGADTADAAAEAVLPVPQRGDRVRLEGLPDRATLRDGWYDVAGATEWGVQIENGFDGYGTKRLYNVERSHVKEVRHADHT